MAVLNQVTEGELLTRIAQARDREAFTELYDRLARNAFNLARAITSNTALAEEAVQEAFYRVWIFPSSFTGGGCARAWILQIVAHESLKKIRTLRRERRDQKDGASRPVWRTAPVDPSSHEAEDRMALLRQGLAELTVLQRHLIGLYFGTGLSQHQVAQAVNLPARTVSHKLERALAQLRENLKRSGWTARVPLALETLLTQAFATGPDPGPDLRQRVLARANPTLPAQIEPLAAGLATRSLAFPGLLLATLLLTGVLLSRPAPQPPAPVAASGPLPNQRAADPPPAQAQPATAQPSPASPPPFKEFYWDFKSGLPSDLEFTGGGIRWLQDPALANGAVQISSPTDGSKPKSQVISPKTRLRCPCLIELRLRFFPQSHASFGTCFGPDHPESGMYLAGHFSAPRAKTEDASLPSTKVYLMRYYVLDEGYLGYLGPTLRCGARLGLPRRPEWDRLYFYCTPYHGSFILDDLRIREIPASEVPLSIEQAERRLQRQGAPEQGTASAEVR